MRRSIAYSIMTLSCFFFATASFAKEPKCKVRSPYDSDNSVEVPVTVTVGAAFIAPQKITFAGIRFWAIFNRGGGPEPQSYFQMHMDDVTSTIYNVTEDTTVPNLEKASTAMFSCWFE